jgi:DNA-binding GntR family transcriptional regulator
MPTAPHSVLTRDELVEVYEIWQLLGPMATARAAAIADQDQILEASRLVSLMRTEPAGSLERASEWAQHNVRFHALLEEVGGGPRVGAILGELRDVSEVHVRNAVAGNAEISREANTEHEEILRAVIARDAERAAQATFRHINNQLHAMLVSGHGLMLATPVQR